MADFASKYTGFKKSRATKEEDKPPPLPPCRCGAEPMLALPDKRTLCRVCYEKGRELSPTEVAILERRLNVPLRIEGESSIAYFLRAYAASTEKRDDDK